MQRGSRRWRAGSIVAMCIVWQATCAAHVCGLRSPPQLVAHAHTACGSRLRPATGTPPPRPSWHALPCSPRAPGRGALLPAAASQQRLRCILTYCWQHSALAFKPAPAGAVRAAGGCTAAGCAHMGVNVSQPLLVLLIEQRLITGAHGSWARRSRCRRGCRASREMLPAGPSRHRHRHQHQHLHIMSWHAGGRNGGSLPTECKTQLCSDRRVIPPHFHFHFHFHISSGSSSRNRRIGLWMAAGGAGGGRGCAGRVRAGGANEPKRLPHVRAPAPASARAPAPARPCYKAARAGTHRRRSPPAACAPAWPPRRWPCACRCAYSPATQTRSSAR